MRTHALAARVLACSALLVASRARADALTIETIEHGSWPAAVAALQTDARAAGAVVRVLVRDEGGHALRCGTYGLSLDPAGARAFASRACDAASGATPLVLVDRSALFEHGAGDAASPDVPSRPRVVSIYAARVESTAIGGGARVEAKSAVACSAEVTPYMPDLERGTRVALRPARYTLLAHGEGVRVSHDDTHWTIARDAATPAGSEARDARAPAAVDYDLVDAVSGAVVLRDRVTLACDAASRGADEPALPAPAVGAASPEPGHIEQTPEKIGSEWEGHALTINAHGGLAILEAGSAVFGNSAATAGAAALGVRDAAGTAVGLAVSYERPWLYTSIAGDLGYAQTGGRSLYAISGSTTVAPSIRIGPVSAYAGPTVALTSYQLTATESGRLEWGTRAAAGLGAAAGARFHLRGDSAASGALGVLGVELSGPIAGRQPLMLVVSLGWGTGR